MTNLKDRDRKDRDRKDRDRKDRDRVIQAYLDFYLNKTCGKEVASAEDAVDYFFSNSICGSHQFNYLLNVTSRSFERIAGVKQCLGYDTEDFDLVKLHQLVHPDDMEIMMRTTDEAFLHLISNHETYPLAAQLSVSYRIRHANGHWVHIQDLGSILSIDDQEMPIKGIFTCVDISQIPFAKVTAHLSCPCNGFKEFRSLQETEPDYGFTRREREIIQLLGTGASSEEIGRTLFISKHTVDKHRSNILKKAGAKRTLELVSLMSAERDNHNL